MRDSIAIANLIGNLGNQIASSRLTSTETKIGAVLCALAGAVASEDPDLLDEWFWLGEDQANRFLATAAGTK